MARAWSNHQLTYINPSHVRYSFFQNCPQAKVLFGFPIDMDPKSDDIKSSQRFLAHGAYLIQMLDASLGMLGPDIELLTEIMVELGSKHWRFGVAPEMYLVMEASLMDAMTDVIGPKIMTAEVKESWRIVFEALVTDMLSAEKP